MEYNKLITLKQIMGYLLSKIISLRVAYFYLIKIIGPNYEDSVKILRSKKPFLITSTGRTGTTLLAKMLNAISENYIVHEPVQEEQYYHAQAIMNHIEALPYIENFRLSEMAYRINKTNCNRYGEVNSALRRHIVELKNRAPFFTIIHIIRDGRNVVTSMLNRNSLTINDRVYNTMIPPKKDINPEEWSVMNRFQKICWMWAYENRYMREHCDYSVRFENLISDYEYFRQNILVPLNLNLSYEIWEQFIKNPVNTNDSVIKSNSYKEWTDEQKAYFWEICGPEMKQFGYFR
ncbi:p-loop domain-containing protein [Desulfonema limicola]|uniref:P-loop domain-containing protein n=1 Tax=Desulfonema limicola TaxID=45656 RepID=A0A975BDL4_9BACT|nr:sulfotransferase [Desulfonema limicola]QTA83260.1 p-loop domain-containing protein [Desulfonema limicola]